jgi:CBS domain-containing membrane protein
MNGVKTMMKDGTLRVRDVMSRDVITVERNDSLALADDQFARARVRHLVVVDEDGGIAGVISSRDLFKGALAGAFGYGAVAQRKTLEMLVAKEVMSTGVVATSPEAQLADAARIMVDRKIGCLPVLDGGKLVGIITEGDFVALAAAGRLAPR